MGEDTAVRSGGMSGLLLGGGLVLAALAVGGAVFVRSKAREAPPPAPEKEAAPSPYTWHEALPERIEGGKTVRVAFSGPPGSDFENVIITGPNRFRLNRGVRADGRPGLFVFDWNTYQLEPGPYIVSVGKGLKHTLQLAEH